MGSHRSRSPAETEALGAELAARLTAGQVVLIAGDLGAGKTTFVRGACRALGVTATAKAVLCCQDYYERLVVGDLKTQTVAEVLGGDVMARLRRWTYGVEEAPADFLCRRCEFALGE